MQIATSFSCFLHSTSSLAVFFFSLFFILFFSLFFFSVSSLSCSDRWALRLFWLLAEDGRQSRSNLDTGEDDGTHEEQTAAAAAALVQRAYSLHLSLCQSTVLDDHLSLETVVRRSFVLLFFSSWSCLCALKKGRTFEERFLQAETQNVYLLFFIVEFSFFFFLMMKRVLDLEECRINED